MPDLRVIRLDEDRLAQAYPLVRSATRVDSERWRQFAVAVIADGGGILAVAAPSGCLHGVASFRPARTLRQERTLQVEVFATIELSASAPVRQALRSALGEIATEEGCTTIQFTLAAHRHAEPNSSSRADWERLGLKLETVGFVQQL